MAGWYERDGSPLPLGVTWIEEQAAYNFALFAKHATHVTLLLYSELDLTVPTYEYGFDPIANKSGRVWHLRLKAKSIPLTRYYAYRVGGPLQGRRNLSRGTRLSQSTRHVPGL